MRHKIKIVFFLIILHSTVWAQTANRSDTYLKSASSPNGNYIYLLNEAELNTTGANILATTDYFIIERVPYESISEDAKKTNIKKIGEARPVQTVKDLKKHFSQSQLQDIKKVFGLSNDEAVLNYFKTHSSITEYPFIYSFIETKQALCHVFLDENVKEGQIYVYDITRVTKSNTKEPWGFSITQSKTGNYSLPYFKPHLSTVKSKDSSVHFEWKLPVASELLSKIPVPVSKIADDSGGMLYRLPFPPATIRARVFAGNNGTFSEVQKVSPVLNATNDTASYFYTKKCVPEEAVNVFLVTEDEVYNTGIASDTAFAFAIEKKMIPLIYGIRVKDVMDGIRISWNPLPSKPYITGVEINRYNSDDKFDSVAILPPGDTSFIDYKIDIGQHYRYKVRALYFPQSGIEQEVPAEGTGTYTLFSKPLPPFNLTAESDKGNVLLKWESVDQPSFFGAYIYRGTSPKNLDLIAGPVKTKYYLDTAHNLTGRSEYYYAVSNQNLRQDTSEYSETVRIVPDKKISTVSPTNIEFYYVNGTLRVSWNDVRTMDNSITGYVVRKKTSREKTYSSITPKPVAANYTEDNDIKEGTTYQYMVAAVSYRGDTGTYSNATEFTLAPKPVSLMTMFYVRNISEGISISWPQSVFEGRKSYNIYRREASATKFSKLATVGADVFSYVDKSAQADKVYVYCMSITQDNGVEGSKGSSKSVRRNKK